jgi:hypothetical protein
MDEALVWELLGKAADAVEPSQFAEYFALRRLLAEPTLRSRDEFARRFATYYRLQSAGLTPDFTQRYFELLFACSPSGVDDPYSRLLVELYEFPRRQGDAALQASFVSKLVAIHDESRPIYDSHVGNFFGITVPSLGSLNFRVARFVANLKRIQVDYETWAADKRFRRIEQSFLQKHRAEKCHPTRICDFLVWTIGAKGLA